MKHCRPPPCKPDWSCPPSPPWIDYPSNWKGLQQSWQAIIKQMVKDAAIAAQGPEGPQGPAGPQGPPGEGLHVKGSVSDQAHLPDSGNEIGDLYVDEQTGHGWVWDGTQWIDLGEIRGPAGATGPQGQPGHAEGPITGVTDGSNAQPGQVGEFLYVTAADIPTTNLPVAAFNVASLTLTPGDWDVCAGAVAQVYCLSSAGGVLVINIRFDDQTVPYSTEFRMSLAMSEQGGAGIPLGPVRVNTAINKTMNLNVSISGVSQGTYSVRYIYIRARRMR